MGKLPRDMQEIREICQPMTSRFRESLGKCCTPTPACPNGMGVGDQIHYTLGNYPTSWSQSKHRLSFPKNLGTKSLVRALLQGSLPGRL